ncbi:MAG: hypothetical protein WC509_03235 [Candidatus Izemoplasmatales bacterium]
MKDNKSRYYLFLIPLIALIVFVISLIDFRPVPEGVPNDYYDRIDLVEKYDVNLFVYSDVIDFNDDILFKRISSMSDLDILNFSLMNVLVIDMNKYVLSEFASEEEIRQLYEVRGVTLMIVNYASSNSEQLEDFINPADVDSDLIIFGYAVDHVQDIGSIIGTFPSNQMLMYAILHQISNTLKEQRG